MNLPMILMSVAQKTQKTGVWASFVNFLSNILEGLNKLTGKIPEPFGGYGLAIILFSILFRLVLLPLDTKSRRANQKIQEIQPELNEINKKYKNDPDKLNKKTMELYQKHQVNPMGGCLPMLIQMPLFIAMFAALRAISEREIALGSVNAFLWIKNIWRADVPVMNALGESISFLPLLRNDRNGLFILPILAGITSYFQIQLSQPKDSDNQQMKGFTAIMPIMSVWFCTNTASFAIYWVTSNLYQIVQSLIMRKKASKKQEEREGDQK